MTWTEPFVEPQTVKLSTKEISMIQLIALMILMMSFLTFGQEKMLIGWTLDLWKMIPSRWKDMFVMIR